MVKRKHKALHQARLLHLEVKALPMKMTRKSNNLIKRPLQEPKLHLQAPPLQVLPLQNRQMVRKKQMPRNENFKIIIH